MHRKEDSMKDVSAYLSIGIVCLVVLMIVFFKNKMEYLLRLLLRGAVGIALIYGANHLFQFMGIDCFVGLNIVSVLTCIILGIPGVCALFLISFL